MLGISWKKGMPVLLTSLVTVLAGCGGQTPSGTPEAAGTPSTATEVADAAPAPPPVPTPPAPAAPAPAPAPASAPVAAAPPPAPPAPPAKLVHTVDFDDMATGETLPADAFFAPGSASSVEIVEAEGATGKAVQQTWSKADSRWAEAGRFTILATGVLKPETEYRVECRAKTTTDTPTFVEAFTITAEGKNIQLAIPVFAIEEGGDWKTFSGTFNTGYSTNVRLTTGVYVEPSAAHTLILDEIRFLEIGPAKWASAAARNAADKLLNGSFERWVPGAPVPAGSFLTPNAEYSTIELSKRVRYQGQQAALQIWNASDSEAKLEDLFGVEVEGLSPNQDYVFHAMAQPGKDAAAEIVVAGVGADGALTMIGQTLVETNSAGDGQVQKLEGRFNSGDYSKVRILTRAAQNASSFPQNMLWDGWELLPAGGDAPAQSE